MSGQYKRISISKLIINPNNDRFEPVENEKDAIDVMLTKLGDKIYYIATHILENGLSPKPFYVIPTVDNRFVVKEGNRRTTALKLMNNPKLIDAKKHASLKVRFTKLHEKFKDNPIKYVYCSVFESLEEVDKWLKLEHTGEQNGVGIVEWKPEQVQRFDIRHGKAKSIEMQAIDFIRTTPFIPEEVKHVSENIKLTNFSRLLGDKNVRSLLGLTYVDSRLCSLVEEEEVAKALAQIVMDLSDKDFKVGKIYNAKQRENYIRNLGDKLPNLDQQAEKAWVLDNPSEHTLIQKDENSSSNTGENLMPKPQNTPKPLPIQRKSLIPGNCILKIENPKINKIYNELQKIDVKHFVNCAAVTLRVFIELTVDTYIEEKGLLKNGEISAAKSSRSLYQKINDVSQYLYSRKLADESITFGIKALVKDNNSIFGVDAMHGYVHSNKLAPIATDIQTTWDNIQDFIVILWNDIETK